MKYIFIATLILLSVGSTAQSKLSCSYAREIQCKDSILQYLKDYKFVNLNTKMNFQYDTYVCVNNNNDSLLFVYYEKYMGSKKEYKLARIISNYTTFEAIYKWLGRKTDFNKLQKEGSDQWDFTNGMIHASKNKFDGKWYIKFW